MASGRRGEGGRVDVVVSSFFSARVAVETGPGFEGGFAVRGGGVERLPRLCPVGVRCACARGTEVQALLSWLRASSRKLRPDVSATATRRRRLDIDMHPKPPMEPQWDICLTARPWSLSARNHRRPARGLGYCPCTAGDPIPRPQQIPYPPTKPPEPSPRATPQNGRHPVPSTRHPAGMVAYCTPLRGRTPECNSDPR